MNADRTADGLRDMLARLNDALARRDPAIAGDFAAEAVFAGSDLSDLCRGRDAIARHFGEIFRLAFTLRFDWDRVESGAEGDLAWLFAEGEAVLARDAGEERLAYHLSGVFRRAGTGWQWVMFHGSAPK